MLVQLLEYDPLQLQPSEPGFGSGSGKPAIMFGFLKHLWNTASGQRAAEQQQQALFRRAAMASCHGCRRSFFRCNLLARRTCKHRLSCRSIATRRQATYADDVSPALRAGYETSSRRSTLCLCTSQKSANCRR